MIKKIILIVGLMYTTLPVIASPNFNVVVSPNTLTLGDIFSYKITIDTLTSDSLIQTPTPESLTNEVVSYVRQDIKKTSGGQGRIIELTYFLQPFGIHKQQVPTQTITLQDAQTKKAQSYILSAYPIYISPTVAPDDLSVKLSRKFFVNKDLNWLPLVFLGIALIAAIIGMVWITRKLFKKIRKSQPVAIQEPQRPPLEVALSSLDHLAAKLDDINIKDFYVEFSDIIKVYLESIVAVDCVELTSEELLKITGKRLKTQETSQLKKLLDFSDQVKFARYSPTPTENQTLLTNARQWVELLESNHRVTPDKESTSKESSL